MDIFKGKGNHTQRGTEHINRKGAEHERTQGLAPFLFAYIPKGKRKQHPKSHKHKAGKERQDKRTRKAKSINSKQTQGHKGKKQGKQRKNRGKHAKGFLSA